MKTAVIGCGYIGARIARAELARGNAAYGLVRSRESLTRLAQASIPARVADLDQHSGLPAEIQHAALVYYLVAPSSRHTRDIRLQNFLAQLPPHQHRRIVLISTTGVYGNHDGRWVDENTPPAPQTARAQRRCDAEYQLLRYATEQPKTEAVILRVGGIYGPGRLPLERIRNRTPVIREQESPYSNRIHADDLCECCLVAAERGVSGETYNACDGSPSSMTSYFYAVADQAGLPRPPAISLQQAETVFTEMQLSFIRESRRVSNRKLMALNPGLRYQDMQQGIAASLTTATHSSKNL